MSENRNDKQDSEDEDSQPQDIRSRIAAFEQTSSPAVAPSSNSTSSGTTASLPTRRTALPQGSYDPLQAASSPPKVNEPVIIRPLDKSRAPPASPSVTKPASLKSTRVALPGLGAPTPSNGGVASTSSTSPNAARPSPLSQTRPWPPVQPATESDVSAAISNAMDATASINNVKAVATPKISLPDTTLASPIPVAATSPTLPPPQLPLRKNSNTSNTSASSNFTNTDVLSNEPSTLSGRIPPPLPGGKPVSISKPASTPHSPADASAPRLPPRKQNSNSSTSSANSTLGSYPLPPQRSSTLSASKSLGTTPTQSRSSSISQPSLSSRPSRSSTMQSDSSSLSIPPSLSSLPPRPRDQSYPNAHFMSPAPSRNLPPLPNNLSRAPSPRHAIANGSRSPLNPPAIPPRYEALWDKLVQNFGQQSHATASPANARIDGIVVRQVWKLSRLNDASLARIWNQCDVNRQGSLDKSGFCKGLSLIDAELRQKGRRQGRT